MNTTAPSTSSLDAVYGVTVNSVTDTPEIVDSLAHLSRRPTTRVVFDDVPVSEYRRAVSEIHKVSCVLGGLVDSSDMRTYALKRYLAKTHKYFDALGSDVDIWEIGNEVNCERTGNSAEVADKVRGAYDFVKERGGVAALTLYYNEGCFVKAKNEMFAWTEQHVPSEIMAGVDYLLVSYYEDDCNNLQPNWPAVFHRLAGMFPSSRLGFGECGTVYDERKETYIRRYYVKNDALIRQAGVPRWIGGYFWWYFKNDMVPRSRLLWSFLNHVWKGRTPAAGVTA